ncbi:MAG: threonine--tRNA ligase, partial [Candidatus Bathyarchaeota archaeon]|nr:threonine--tRNA ligase [Candidatus Bathyarchaeota archaeon]
MRVLLIHTDHFEYQTKDKAIKNPEQITQDNKEATMDEALIAFCTIEKDDEKNPKEISKRASDSIKEVAELVKTKNIMVYPYAHLSSNLGSADIAIPLLEDIEKELHAAGYIVKRSPFGYYKKFNMACKGHPLSELSRNIVAEKKEKKAKPIKTTYKVLKIDGKVVSPEEYTLKPDNEEFNALVMKEALKKE